MRYHPSRSCDVVYSAASWGRHLLSSKSRDTFDAAELAVVLSHYDLGVLESITEFEKGSRRSPKVGIVSERGKFLLKRRAAARANPHRVAFAHRIIQHLTAAEFPVAKLIPTRNRKQTVVELRDSLYELFEFIPGHAFERSAREAGDAGNVLARFQMEMEDFAVPSNLPVPRGDYHDTPGVRTGLSTIGNTLSSHDSFSGDEMELLSLVQFLRETYDKSADAVNALGFDSWPTCVIHGDWHPGNLLFRKRKVRAVVDFDSVRASRRVADEANGVLQFSILAGGDPASWPDELDEDRFRAFLGQYQSLITLSEEERHSIPHMMAEALIAECVSPIVQTGTVGRWAGFRVLQMVRRKLTWLAAHADRLLAATVHSAEG